MIINDTFLERNGFKRAWIGAGSFPWYYEDSEILVSVCNDSVECKPYLYVENKNTHRSIQYSATQSFMSQLTENELHNVIRWLECPDNFDYTEA